MKSHEPEPHGRIARTFPDQGFGFVTAPDGHEVYFHRYALIDKTFESLRVGEAVAFSEEPGEKGPHATIVRPI